ncbi:MAG: chromosomal replication initiator protein DnaA [Candidatus Berkelbacteria bacterium]|nr:chromosomal replication initiator protein DnaA [Candidatus Berkelbacteria bacterium]
MTNPIWRDILNTLEPTMSRPNFATWLASTDLIEEIPGVLTITVPNQYAKSWLENHIIGDIEKLLRKGVDNYEQLRIVVSKKGATSLEDLPILQRVVDETPNEGESEKAPKTNPFNPKYTFESFIVGNNNRLAFAAAHAVADKPGEAYNPLFLYGGVGLGKTHLMQAVANHITLNNPKKKIAYVSCETFASEFIEALQNKAINEFKRKYRSVDVFLVDDIQFLANKEGTQEEFFHTFNTLHQANRQIVMTADRMPKEIGDLEDRLISRIGWGMVADIQTPNFENRVAILQAKAKQMNFEAPPDVLEYIANTITNNIRELEGSLTKLATTAKVEERPVTIELTKEVMKDLARPNTKNITTKKVIKVVTEQFGIDPTD